MNLEQSVGWLREEIEKEISQGAEEKKIRVYQKYLDWLDELLRWRLFYSEYHREYHLSLKKKFTKKEVLDFLDEECEEWKLKPYGDNWL